MGVEVNRIEFGKLVASLRRELKDDNELGWSQRRLGEETGLGEIVIGNIERGRRIPSDSDTLHRLANALGLTTGERREFFLAAVDVDGHQMARPERHPEDVLNEMICMIAGIQSPAFILDSYGDFLAAKNAMIRLFEVPSEAVASAFTEPAGFNMMRLIFAPEFENMRDIFGQKWHRMAVHNMEFFRCITLRYRFTDYFVQTLSQLRKYPLFRRFWQEVHFQRDDYCPTAECYKYEHPKYGPIEYFATLSSALTIAGELYLVAYAPLNARTSDMFARLAEQDGTTVLRLAPWPEKAVPARPSCPPKKLAQVNRHSPPHKGEAGQDGLENANAALKT